MAVDADFERELHRAMQKPPAGSLFETFADKALRRVDDVLAGRECKWSPDLQATTLLRDLRAHQGASRAVPLTTLAETLHLGVRTIKDLVRDLRLNFGVLICSSREGDAGGYWIAATDIEVEEAMRPLFNQAISELRVVHAMRRGSRTIDETLSQIRLELEKDPAPHV